jgi:hypothetical protein
MKFMFLGIKYDLQISFHWHFDLNVSDERLDMTTNWSINHIFRQQDQKKPEFVKINCFISLGEVFYWIVVRSYVNPKSSYNEFITNP